MRWLKNFERLQEIQSQLIWPSVSELEPRVFIPEFLRQSLIRQPCERLIANPKRQLLHEGFLTLNGKLNNIILVISNQILCNSYAIIIIYNIIDQCLTKSSSKLYCVQ